MIKLRKFNFNEVRKEYNELLLKNKKQTTNKILDDLKEATPIDTGFARKSWSIKDGDIINAAPYISLLNSGSSAQAPVFFIERTVLRRKGVKANGMIVTKAR